MHVHLQPVQYIARAYQGAPADASFASKEPFPIVANVFSTGAGTAYLFAAHGEALDRETWADLAAKLIDAGFHTLTMERRGRIRTCSLADLMCTPELP